MWDANSLQYFILTGKAGSLSMALEGLYRSKGGMWDAKHLQQAILTGKVGPPGWAAGGPMAAQHEEGIPASGAWQMC